MFRVDDLYDEAKGIIGQCDDKKLFRWLGDAVSLIANIGRNTGSFCSAALGPAMMRQHASDVRSLGDPIIRVTGRRVSHNWGALSYSS